MVVIAGIVGVLVIIAGAFAIAMSSDSPSNAGNSQIETAPVSPSQIPTGAADTTADSEVTQEPVQVNNPEFTNFTDGVERVPEQYSEQYVIGDITVAWRPGAFPASMAEQVAEKTRAAIDEANGKLGTKWQGPVEIYLADQLYTPECLGCMGFTAADLNRIFILQDGSVAEDEFDSLLVHEVTHLIAAHVIYEPLVLFFAEGLATWVMTDDLVEAGYLSPVQSAAWIYRAGAMPPLADLLEDDFAGRMRKRVSYDASASFVFFIVDTYGWNAYRKLYTYDPPELALDKSWDELEQEWHAYLDQFAGNEIDGVDALEWWSAASEVIRGYEVLYEDPSAVTADQYADLTVSRLALNRGNVDQAIVSLSSSGLVTGTAQ